MFSRFLNLRVYNFCFLFVKKTRNRRLGIQNSGFDLMSTLFESKNQNKNKSNGSSVSLIRHFRNWRPDCNLDFRVAPRPRGWGHNHNPLVLQIGLLHRDLLRQKSKKFCENHRIKNWTLQFDEKKREHF